MDGKSDFTCSFCPILVPRKHCIVSSDDPHYQAVGRFRVVQIEEASSLAVFPIPIQGDGSSHTCMVHDTSSLDDRQMAKEQKAVSSARMTIVGVISRISSLEDRNVQRGGRRSDHSAVLAQKRFTIPRYQRWNLCDQYMHMHLSKSSIIKACKASDRPGDEHSRSCMAKVAVLAVEVRCSVNTNWTPTAHRLLRAAAKGRLDWLQRRRPSKSKYCVRWNCPMIRERKMTNELNSPWLGCRL